MQTDTICGARAVAALFRRRPGDVLRLFYGEAQRHLAGPFCAELARGKRPYRLLLPEELARAAGTPHHGGIAAVAKARVVPVLDPANPPRARLLLVLDGVGNPHNLGAVARSAAFFGVGALLIHHVPGAALPSDAAYRTAEGGLEYLDLYRTRDLAALLPALAPHFRTVAATLRPGAVALDALPRDRPIALVLGAEEAGVSPPVLAACRREVRIAGAGQLQSLNVAQAAAVFLHALGDRAALA
jgi:TrmH RNA methyltransferase